MNFIVVPYSLIWDQCDRPPICINHSRSRRHVVKTNIGFIRGSIHALCYLHAVLQIAFLCLQNFIRCRHRVAIATVLAMCVLCMYVFHILWRQPTILLDKDVKNIVLMPGWSNYIGEPRTEYPEHITCTDKSYICSLYYLKGLWTFPYQYQYADLVVFHETDITRDPPKKYQSQLWAFRTGESQSRMTQSTDNWNGFVNYTVDFREGATRREYSYLVENKSGNEVKKRDFYSEKLRMARQKYLEPSVLWFVSNCHSFPPYVVTSARTEYASELQRWMDVSVFTRSKYCSMKWYHLYHLKSSTTGHPRNMRNYTFYLSFENSLCQDYITEKLWKVLLDDSLTIPVVLGGISTAEYESIAPPNSYIHVRNFTSPAKMAQHLKFVANNAEAFNYYHQWRNSYALKSRKMFFHAWSTLGWAGKTQQLMYE